ncbi:MAG: chemotaxis response regulator protein-glutamate methylesterase [Candidatus Zixiibacteriota bacterium]|nr:MAG: chemotaxis response regulator protein-glutamate methylesterase [candidate division Zixibacteria bacterium]
MRKALTMMLESDPAIKVIGTARDGQEGVEKARQLKPDLVTMDIEMPRMDGLTALREIMASNPMPVMMVASMTTEGAQATLEALELGAVDFIPKQMSYVSLDIIKIKDDLLAKIKDIASRRTILMSRFRRLGKASSGRWAKDAATEKGNSPYSDSPEKRCHPQPIGVIAIGSSTGGPPALQKVIPKLPRSLPAGIIVAQHMPPTFTRSLADRLDGMSRMSVQEAAGGERVEPGTVLIAPGGRQMIVKKRGFTSTVEVFDAPADTLYKPCVDVTMLSVAEAYGGSAMGVVLTGMGSNGIDGFTKIHDQGGVVIAQNEESCVVYGMPRAVIEAEKADQISHIDNIANEIASYF